MLESSESLNIKKKQQLENGLTIQRKKGLMVGSS